MNRSQAKFVSRKALPRRTFLRGMGATLALPLLDAMTPAFAASGPWTPRLGFVYVGNGIVHKTFKLAGTGTSFEFSPVLKPLAPLREHLTVVSGLDHAQANNLGDGTGDHPRSSAAWLTGVHAYDRTRPGVEVKLATTADQLAADVLGVHTPVRSLELAVDTATQSACDSGDCFYVNTVSWRNETTPNLTENHPRVVFERLFGDGGTGAERAVRTQKTASILDSVRAEANRLAASVGASDRSKLAEYLDSVREIEQRIGAAETESHGDVELPERPLGIPASFDDYAKLMLDLQLLAFQTDTTRVCTLAVGSDEAVFHGVVTVGYERHAHTIEHQGNAGRPEDADPISREGCRQIHAWYSGLFAEMVRKMKAIDEGGSTLLDNTMLLYTSYMADGGHGTHNYPALLVGNAQGTLKTGRQVSFQKDTPVANLYTEMLDRMGVKTDGGFGNARTSGKAAYNGRLPGLGAA
jgi:hypothetical protein